MGLKTNVWDRRKQERTSPVVTGAEQNEAGACWLQNNCEFLEFFMREVSLLFVLVKKQVSVYGKKRFLNNEGTSDIVFWSLALGNESVCSG